MADMLSMHRVDAVSKVYPNSPKRLLIHLSSLPASTPAMYSASVEERATTVWSLDDQCGRDFNLLVVRRSGYHVTRGYVSKNKGMRGVKEI